MHKKLLFLVILFVLLALVQSHPFVATASENYFFSSPDVKVTTSSHAAGYEPEHVLTYEGLWHTPWGEDYVAPPHWIQLDLGQEVMISGIKYLPRQDMQHSRITEYRISTSLDGKSYTEAAVGTWDYSDSKQQVVRFPEAKARFIKLEVVKSYSEGEPGSSSIQQLEVIFSYSTSEIAQGITSIVSPTGDSTRIEFPAVPEGMVIELKSDDSGLVSKDGTFTRPRKDVTANLVFTVKKLSDGAASDTNPIQVVIPAEYDVWNIAAKINSIKTPYKDDLKISLPEVPDGYSIRISSSSNPNVISANGKVTPPVNETKVRLTLTVQSNTDHTAATTSEIIVAVPAKSSSASVENYKLLKYGMFVHYMPNTSDSNGVMIYDINQLANRFDVQEFANDLSEFGVQYIIFTAWHGDMFPLYPSAILEKYRPGKSAHRDLIGEMIRAVKAKNIKVFLYTHPRLGGFFSTPDKIATGWGPTGYYPDMSIFDYGKWNNFLAEMYSELMDRYAVVNSQNQGVLIDGIYMDEGDPDAKQENIVDYPRMRDIIKARNEKVLIVQNFHGNQYTADVPDAEVFHNWGFESANGNSWLSKNSGYSIVISKNWNATEAPGENTVSYSPESLFRFTVLNAGMNKIGGGVKWAAGPYVGGGWETGVAETMKRISNYIAPIKASIYNTYPSKAYVTPEGNSLNFLRWTSNGGNSWGIATDSIDGRFVYLHILLPPEGKVLNIGLPENKISFSKAELLPNGTSVAMKKLQAGYQLTLPDDEEWSKVDTVIRLSISGFGSATNSSITDIQGHWAEASISELVKLGAIKGYPDNSFKPNNYITRAEFVAVIVKALHLKIQDGKTFSDTSRHWARNEIGTAAGLGIVTGYDDFTFGPDDRITREQMAAIIIRAANISSEDNTISFSDVPQSPIGHATTLLPQLQ